jgi:hypothetical protein
VSDSTVLRPLRKADSSLTCAVILLLWDLPVQAKFLILFLVIIPFIYYSYYLFLLLLSLAFVFEIALFII